MYASKDRRSARTAKQQQHRIAKGCLNRQADRQAAREIAMGWTR